MAEESALADELGPEVAAAREVGFEDFVIARGDRLLRTAYLLTHDHQLAEDLLQTAFARSWRAWNRIGTDHEAYVRKVLANTYASWWRRKWNGERASETLPETPTEGHHDGIDHRHDLWEALARLPKRQRAVLVLRYFEDMAVTEVADALGCSTGAVKSQSHKALAKLRIDPQLLAGYVPDATSDEEGGRP